MGPEDTDSAADTAYVIGRANDLAPGEAKAFSLSRIMPGGEARPFAVFVVRLSRHAFVGYVNVCPHGGTWLNIDAGRFFSADRKALRCGRHGALFEAASGRCVEGPCEGAALEALRVAVLDGDLCLLGVELAEDDGLPDPFRELDDTLEIMIHPD